MPITEGHERKRRVSTAFKVPRPGSKGISKKSTNEKASHGRPGKGRAPTFSPSDDEEEQAYQRDDCYSSDDAIEVATIQESAPVTMLPSGELPTTIPPALLTRLLHHFFAYNHTTEQQKGKPETRISKDAMAVVHKYIETFLREAIARAAYERQQTLAEKGEETKAAGNNFLEVEDLEKLAPQLLLDF